MGCVVEASLCCQQEKQATFERQRVNAAQSKLWRIAQRNSKTLSYMDFSEKKISPIQMNSSGCIVQASQFCQQDKLVTYELHTVCFTVF